MICSYSNAMHTHKLHNNIVYSVAIFTVANSLFMILSHYLFVFRSFLFLILLSMHIADACIIQTVIIYQAICRELDWALKKKSSSKSSSSSSSLHCHCDKHYHPFHNHLPAQEKTLPSLKWSNGLTHHTHKGL